MRKTFYEYYGLSEEEFDKLWKEGLVVFDTNVLLSLYRLRIEDRQDILEAMKEIRDRIWIPYRVGYEYHQRRLEEAYKPIEKIKQLLGQFEAFKKSIEEDLTCNPYIANYKQIERTLNTLHSRVEKSTKEWLDTCPDFLHDDKVLLELTSLFDGKVGDPYNDDKLTEIYKLGEERYEQCIPPGYKDSGKNSGIDHRFGDLIIWFQIIDKAKQSDKDIIFVTEDKKEDWWWISHGNKIGPRKELTAEFRRETGNHLLGFYSTKRFLLIAKERQVASVKKGTIDRIKQSDMISLDDMTDGIQPGLFSTNPISIISGFSLGESKPISIFASSSLRDCLSLQSGDEGASEQKQPEFERTVSSSTPKSSCEGEVEKTN